MKDRYEILKNLLDEEKCFKMICGAGNEDKEYVKKLSLIYTLAGATILDVSANPEVVKYAHDGIDLAYEKAAELGIQIDNKPYIMVSVGMPGDHHVRKSYIDPFKCISCGLCVPVCPTAAIPEGFFKKDALDIFRNLGGSFEEEDQNKEVVIKDLCIGCGKCSNICPRDDIISYRHNDRQLRELLPRCIDAGTECFELHAAVGEEEVTLKEWQVLVDINPENYNSLCLDRLNLGNLNIEHRIENIIKMSNSRLIVQADGYPMSGGENDMNTTLQAVACADVINKKFNMKVNKRKDATLVTKAKIASKRIYKRPGNKTIVPIVLSGGTNSLSKKLADQCGVRVNGIAVGTYARDIVEAYVNVKDFYENSKNLHEAYKVARSLVLSNIKEGKGDEKLTIAVDFDGTLCNYAFPEIGEQTDEQKLLMQRLIKMKNSGHKLILYTCRGDSDEYPCLTEAIQWCNERGLFFDAVNCNVSGFVKKSGPSPKPVANIYLDDKALSINNWRSLL